MADKGMWLHEHWDFSCPISESGMYAPLVSETDIDAVIQALKREEVDIDLELSEQHLAYQLIKTKAGLFGQVLRQHFDIPLIVALRGDTQRHTPKSVIPIAKLATLGYSLRGPDIELKLHDQFFEAPKNYSGDLIMSPGRYQGTHATVIMKGRYIDRVEPPIDPTKIKGPVLFVLEEFFSPRRHGELSWLKQLAYSSR